MRRLVLLAILAALAGLSPAQARQSALALSCVQARALVAREGAVVLSTGRYTFERFVAGRFGNCAPHEYAERAWVDTRDGRCRIGYTCEPGPRLFMDDGILFAP